MTIYDLATILDIPKELISDKSLDEKTKHLAHQYNKKQQTITKHIEKQDNYPEQFLYLIMHLAILAKKQYKTKGISEKIWLDTISDIKIWQKAYQNKYQKSGILEHRWVLKTVNMEIFKLESLQFEPIILKEEIKLQTETIKKGSHALNTHIQQGADITINKLEQSYRQAEEFFESDLFLCDSWLLCQDLQKLLNPQSNIIKFQNMYEIISEIRPHTQMEERVFGTYQKDKKAYQATTTLQKNLQKYLIAGNTVSMAKGCLRLKP